jgi:hypothetical protein
MDETFWLELIHGVVTSIDARLATWTAALDRIAFLLQATALGVCWLAGLQSLKFFLYVKNHKDLW